MAETYTTKAKVRLLTGISSTDVISDANLVVLITEAEKRVDNWYCQDGLERSNLIFGINTTTETNEEVDYKKGTYMIKTLYPHIVAITSLSFRTGNSTWETKTDGIENDYYYSSVDKQYGRIWLNSQPGYETTGARVTYTHGFATVPTWVSELTEKITAMNVYQACLEEGAPDIFNARVAFLQSEIDRIKSEPRTLRKGFAVVG